MKEDTLQAANIEFQARKARTLILVEAMEKAFGQEETGAWLWGCTPYPADLPSEEQFAEGEAILRGELTIHDARRKADEEMHAAYQEYKAKQALEAPNG